MRLRSSSTAMLAGVLLAPALALAAPLTLTQLDALGSFVDCRDRCSAGPAQDTWACMQGCGAEDPLWEKDGVEPVTRNDYELAKLERADAGSGTQICYRDGGSVVVPAPLCANPLCQSVHVCTAQECTLTGANRPQACPDVVCQALPQRSATDCADADQDGIPAWLERAQQSSDTTREVTCSDDSTCGFQSRCTYIPATGTARCAPRTCSGPCTAFHLETVSVDDQQVLVHVFFDYAPTPARVLEVFLTYEHSALVLADARPLPNLTAFGHQLHSSHLADGTLRLVMYGPDGGALHTGPLAELVFLRTGSEASTVRFVTTDAMQETAMAPNSSATQRQALREDSLWGSPVVIPARADADGNRLLLHYSFDDPDNPLAYSGVPSAEELCLRVPDCAAEPDAVLRQRFVARLARLQRGSVKASGSVEGVSRGGLLLNGATDHLRLPVHVLQPYEPAGQSFSFSTWVYAEGAPDTETAPQLVFSQLGPDERTRFGLLLRREVTSAGVDRSSLQFFTGDVVSSSSTLALTPLGQGFPNRTWHHVAFTLNAATGQVVLFLDGLRVGTAALPASPSPVQCPGFLRGSDVVLHQEGEYLGGRVPEVAYLAPKRGPFFQVERTDLDGFASQAILANGRNNFQDVDYLPLLDKIAYSTDASGDFEIFIANSDGTNPQQITKGFGDTGRLLFARHPRWAPDGTGLIFESNIYSVPDEHNTEAGTQLYYVTFNPSTGQPAIPLEGGSTVTELDYTQLLSMQVMGSVQLTQGAFHHAHAAFFSGVAGSTRGDIVFERTDLAQRGGHIRRMTIPRNFREATSTAVEGLNDATGLCADPRDGASVDIACGQGSTITSVDFAYYGNSLQIAGTCQDPQFTVAAGACGRDVLADVSARCVGRQSCRIQGADYGDSCPNVVKRIAVRARCSFPASAEQRLLAAAVQVSGIGTQVTRTPIMLYTRRAANQVFLPSTQLTAQATSSATGYRVSVVHQPTGYAADCWDVDHNGRADVGSEDLDGDGSVTVADCYPAEAFAFIKYDDTKAAPLVTGGLVQGGSSDAVTALRKSVALGLVESGGSKYVRLAITSPRDLTPLPTGAIGYVQFTRVTDNAPFSVHERDRSTPNELLIKRFPATGPTLPATVALSASVITDPVDGAFSPDGARLLLSGMFAGTRPVLVRTAGTQNVEGSVRVGEFFAPVRGISWVREESYQACNWVGGVLHPASHVLARPLRGALDDLRIYAGLRDEESIRSEAALGIERLRASNRTTPAERLQGPCATNSDCDAYTLCQAGRCAVVACDPTSPTACAAQNARCTLRPASVRTSDFDGPTPPRWVCAVDCAADAECFTQSCSNGPCRFCEEPTGSCVECRESVQTVGGFTARVTEGCPDRNSFLCDNGTCETECYSIRDGLSVYRCDPTLEFCRNGRCEALRWDWTDVAPASLLGLAETGYQSVPGAVRTVAVGEGTAIEVKAYGKGDYGHSPELLVEAQLVRSGGVSAGSYYGGEWFRVGRIMVDNRTRADAAAHPYVLHVPHPISDLRMRLVHTPYENLDNAATGLGAKDKDFCLADVGTGSQARCKYRPPGSAQHLGYAAEVSFDQVARDCARDHAGCPSVTDPLRKYLGDGTPAILVTEARVNGSSATLDANPVCSWEGSLEPLNASTGRRKKLYYGNVAAELSATKRKACGTACPTTGLLDFRTVSNGAYGLLNCDYSDPATNQVAVLDFTLPPYVQRFQSGSVRETANSCFVEVDPVRREQCYEFIGGDVSMDVLASAQDVFQTLEFNLPRAFAHDEGFTRVNTPTSTLTAAVTGLSTGATVRVRNARNGTTVDIPGDSSGTAVTRSFAAPLPVGQRYELEIATQPDGHLCAVYLGAAGTMVSAGVTATVMCRKAGWIFIGGWGMTGNAATVELVAQESRLWPGTEILPNRRFFWTFKPCTQQAPNACAGYLAPQLPDGTGYTVSVVSHPTAPTQFCTLTQNPPSSSPPVASAGTLGFAATSGAFFLTCVDTPNRALGGRVTGLAGAGLVLRSVTTSETRAITPAAGGAAVNFAFSTRIPPGAPYNVVVDQHPVNQQCFVENPSGTMPNNDVTNLRVTCSNAPTYAVSVEATAVAGRGLALRLNGSETLAVPQDGVYTFATRLLAGASYQVDVASQPVTPDQDCQVVAGSGAIVATNVGNVRVICGLRPAGGTQFTVGGKLNGMLGSGLRLTLGGSAATVGDAGAGPGSQQLDLDRNGSFTFRTPVGNNEEYTVRVLLQPVNPAQVCTVTNYTGRISGADVTNVTVTCAGASTMSVRFTAGSALSAPDEAVRLVLFGADGVPRARSRDNARLGPAGTLLSLVDFGATEADPPEAALRPGNYTLVGITNSSHSGAAPWFEAGDLGFVKAATVPAGGTAAEVGVPLTLATSADGGYTSGLVATVTEPISLRGAEVPADASVTCYWLVPTGARPSLPVGASVATSRLECLPDQVPCFRYLPSLGTMAGTTTVETPLVPGRYDVMCWLDRSPGSSTPDNILGTGDRVGFAANVTADGPGLLTTQAVVTLDAP
ncbi:MAG: hypothetical protein HY904_20475 [Deltaproteobacteria bacterium]|nr:hypothetical protein [Deltaproteobacteria bacterium]